MAICFCKIVRELFFIHAILRTFVEHSLQKRFDLPGWFIIPVPNRTVPDTLLFQIMVSLKFYRPACIVRLVVVQSLSLEGRGNTNDNIFVKLNHSVILIHHCISLIIFCENIYNIEKK